MEIPVELVKYHVIPYCEVKSVINLFATCEDYRFMGTDELWNYLLDRDYNPVVDFYDRYKRQKAKRMYKFLFEKIGKAEGEKISIRRRNRGQKQETVIFQVRNPGLDRYFTIDFEYRYPIAESLLYSLESQKSFREMHQFQKMQMLRLLPLYSLNLPMNNFILQKIKSTVTC